MIFTRVLKIQLKVIKNQKIIVIQLIQMIQVIQITLRIKKKNNIA